VAEVGGSYLYKNGEVMRLIERSVRSPAISKKAGVRVKLERIDCDASRSLPPDGDHQTWIDRLKAALGVNRVRRRNLIPAPGGRAPPKQRGVGDSDQRCARHDRK
jgi:hypothetical protein